MGKVYISGALTNVSTPLELKSFYETIGDKCRDLGHQPYIPHLKTDPVDHPTLSPEEVYKIDKHNVSTSQLIIAYVGIPSLGVGIELGIADECDIPIILLYETENHISLLPRGLPHIVAEIKFDTYDDAMSKLKNVLENILNRNE